ncbi:pyridoxal phosphate-dependent aminotransferase [Flagellimonas flava]|uniref:pyridoxal phosphate-dependent aminotransferase n=1 Tax=Flagellimonas flava TaxID=570519 RepID=UPI003D64A22D
MIDLSSKMSMVKPSATLAINELSAKLINEGKEVYRLGFGQSPFPVPEIIVEELKRQAHQKDYLPVQGLLPLRQAVAQFFQREYQLAVGPENVLVGPGSKELIFNFQVAVDLDELLLPTPSWVSYEPQALLSGHKVVWLDTQEGNGYKLDAKLLSDYCRENPGKKRVIILNYPSNPLGSTYSESELKDLAEVLKQEEIVVIADEIYGEVHHEGEHHTIATYYPEGTIISTGLSKWAGAGGWRFGIFVFPKTLDHIRKAMAVVASETFTSVSAPIQYAAIEAYRENQSLQTYLRCSRQILKAVGFYVYEELTKIGVTMPKPEGGFYLYPNFGKWKKQLNSKGINNSEDLCSTLLNETGVALLPGMAFGHLPEHLTARLSYVDFDGKQLLDLLMKNPETDMGPLFVQNNCPKMKQGVQNLITWLTAI